MKEVYSNVKVTLDTDKGWTYFFECKLGGKARLHTLSKTVYDIYK